MDRIEIERNSGFSGEPFTIGETLSHSPMTVTADGRLWSSTHRPGQPPGRALRRFWGQIDINGRGTLTFLPNYLPPGGRPADRRDMIRYTVDLAPGGETVRLPAGSLC